jgi:hypothetical protein
MIKEKVVLYLERFKIVGYFHLKEGFRITDYLNQVQEKYIPLTEVVIYNNEGEFLRKENFICVNKEKILLAMRGEENE